MKTVTMYETSDGRRFDSEFVAQQEEAKLHSYNALVKLCNDIVYRGISGEIMAANILEKKEAFLAALK